MSGGKVRTTPPAPPVTWYKAESTSLGLRVITATAPTAPGRGWRDTARDALIAEQARLQVLLDDHQRHVDNVQRALAYVDDDLARLREAMPDVVTLERRAPLKLEVE